MIVVSDTSPLTALLAKQARLISSARELLERLDQEAGVCLGEELKAQALKNAGE